jgi:hypothetical protein
VLSIESHKFLDVRNLLHYKSTLSMEGVNTNSATAYMRGKPMEGLAIRMTVVSFVAASPHL